MTERGIRTRFAPSPTGYLHLGHVISARAAFNAHEIFGQDEQNNASNNGPNNGEDEGANQTAYSCLLRIEDIDHTRCKPEFTRAIIKDLNWLGFNWPRPVRVQSQQLGDYAKVIDALRQMGLAYRCFRTRRELAQTRPAPLPRAEERARLKDGMAFAWRLSIAQARKALKDRPPDRPLDYIDTGQRKTVSLARMEDIVIARRDIGTSYHIAVTHDDMAQNITHVVRGADFIEQTGYHILIQALMGWPHPVYHHHALIMGKDGKKLSKRHFAASIASMREAGQSPSDVLGAAQRALRL